MSASKLSKIENGHMIPAENDLRGLIELFEAPTYKQEQLILACRRLEDERRFGTTKPTVSITSSDEEISAVISDCTRICSIHTHWVPWELQTPKYIERYFIQFEPDMTPTEINRRIITRLKRQAELFDQQRSYEIVVFESVFSSSLCLESNSAELSELAHRYSAFPHIDVRVVPDMRPSINDFSIYGSAVVADMLNRAIITTERSAHRFAEDQFNSIRSLSVGGDEALEIIDRYVLGSHTSIDLRDSRTET